MCWPSGIPAAALVMVLAVVGLAAGRVFEAEDDSKQSKLENLEASAVRVYEQVVPAVVGIRARGSRGSGVIVSEEGLVLTAAHVFMTEGQEATVYLADGRRVRAVSRGRDERLDTGLLEIVGDGPWPHIELGDSKGLERGEWCLAFGHPGGYVSDRPPVIRVGRVLANDGDLLRTDCAIASGDSGGPLVDLDGRLIGIHSRIFRRITRNYHVPIDRFRDGWAALRNGTPFLGVQTRSSEEGWYVEHVIPDSAADRAGIVSGDLILSVGKRTYRTDRSLAAVLRSFGPRERVAVTILRGTERQTIQVTLLSRREFDQ